MSIAEAIRDAAAPLVPLRSFEIEKRIFDAQKEHAALSVGLGAIALDAEAGLPGAAEKFAALQADLKAKAERVAHLQLALTAAQEAEQRERFALQARKRKRDMKRVEGLLADRATATEALVRAIGQAVPAWHSLIQASRDLEQFTPSVVLNGGSDLLGVARLRGLVEAELYRQGAPGGIDEQWSMFPGAKTHSEIFLEDYAANPQSTPPLVDTIAALNARIVALLTGQREPIA